MLSYQTYYNLLINACVRYDKTKKANIAKRRNVYNSTVESCFGGIDLSSDEFYQIHALSSRHPPSPRRGSPPKPHFRPQSQQSGPQKSFKMYDGPAYLPPQIFRLLSQDAMKGLKAYNTEAINWFHKRKVHTTDVVEEPQIDAHEPSDPDSGLSGLPATDLSIPEDSILNFVNSQCHKSDDLDLALQASQAYQVPTSQDSTLSPERTINHHYTYHITQASKLHIAL